MTPSPRPWLARIDPYRPGRHAASGDGSLSSNESPIGASPRVAAAINAAASAVHHYPDPLADELRAELAAEHGVHPDQILVGNGSDELIYLMATAYAAHGGRVVCADPPYRIDEISAYVTGADVVRVPLRDWAHDLEAMAEVAAEIAYVCNPHNPTASVRSRADIERFTRNSRAGLVVVDEAYIDFTDDPAQATAMPLAAAGAAVVLRTFSKVHGLAGLRVGYLVGDRDVVATLRRIRAPFSVGTLAQAAAVAALRDPGHRQRVRDHVLRYRARLVELLDGAGYPVVPSPANFVLVETADEDGLVAELARHAITVRPGSALGMPGTVRISVPSAGGMQLLEAALSSDADPMSPLGAGPL